MPSALRNCLAERKSPTFFESRFPRVEVPVVLFLFMNQSCHARGSFCLIVPHLSTEKDDSDTMRKKKVLSCVYHAMLGVELFLAPL